MGSPRRLFKEAFWAKKKCQEGVQILMWFAEPSHPDVQLSREIKESQNRLRVRVQHEVYYGGDWQRAISPSTWLPQDMGLELGLPGFGVCVD